MTPVKLPINPGFVRRAHELNLIYSEKRRAWREALGLPPEAGRSTGGEVKR